MCMCIHFICMCIHFMCVHVCECACVLVMGDTIDTIDTEGNYWQYRLYNVLYTYSARCEGQMDACEDRTS